jgi:hypothetical protein
MEIRMSRTVKPNWCFSCNGWEIEKCVNTFAEKWAWQATAVDADGFQTEKHGFNTKREAVEFCEANDPPLTRATA